MEGVLRCPIVSLRGTVYSERLAELMLKATEGRSYRKIARDAGISPSTIGNMVLGRVPSADICTAVANALGIPPSAVLEASGHPVPEPDDLIRKYVQRCRGVIDREHMEAAIKKILDEEMREPEGYEPEP